MKDAYTVIKNPISSEKAVRLMEAENKLLFAVAKDASKPEIKAALETMFKIKIEKVNTVISPGGKKRAYVKLAADTPAIDVATELGMI